MVIKREIIKIFFQRNAVAIAGIIVTFFIASGLVVFAWQGPTKDPPQDNVAGYIWNSTNQQPNSNVNISGSITAGVNVNGSNVTANNTLTGGSLTVTNSGTVGSLKINGATDAGNITIRTGSQLVSPSICLPSGNCKTSWNDVGGADNDWAAVGVGAPTLTGAIYHTGNVGIGVTNPGAKLEIAGLVYQSGLGNSTYFGYGAGSSDDKNSRNNVGIGYQALYANTAGIANTANGYQALYSNTTGNANTANGIYALYSNTTGRFNTAVGADALRSNTTAWYNTANGWTALRSNTTGEANTANGYAALYYNTTGGANTANGYQALYANTTGGSNTANGYSTLYNNTTGPANTANGYQALYANTTGGSNTANGYVALYRNTTGNVNTANGANALSANTTGGSNTAIGAQALEANTTGVANTAVGHRAFSTNITGNYNTAIGYQAGYNVNGISNSTAIGNGAVVTASNQVVIGNTSVIQTILNGDISAKAFSTGIGNLNIKPQNAVDEGGELILSPPSGYTSWHLDSVQGRFRIFENGINHFVILPATGNVGVGTYTPGYKLDVQGGQINASGGLCINNSCRSDWGSNNFWKDGGSSNIYNVNTGNVGIGTATPNAKLEVSGGSSGINASGTNYGGYFSGGSIGVVGVGTNYGGFFSGGSTGHGVTGVAASPKFAGLFYGSVNITDTLTVANLNTTGNKNFIMDHPTDPTKQIIYTSLEGPESGTYVRGSGQLQNGTAVINLEESFSLVTSEKGLTVQVTTTAETKGLYVVSKSTKQIVVKEIGGGIGNATFDYLVQGIRKGYENKAVIVDKKSIPQPPTIEEITAPAVAGQAQPQDDNTMIKDTDANQAEGTFGPSSDSLNNQIVGQPDSTPSGDTQLNWWQKVANFFQGIFKR